MAVLSPITGSTNTTHVLDINTEQLCQQYLQETKVDVRRFFVDRPSIQLYTCNDTGYRFYYPDGIWGDGKFYEDLESNNSWYYARNRWEHHEGLKRIQPSDKVLEIGCGDGVFLNMMREKGVKDLTALELNEKAASQLQQAGYDVRRQFIQEFAYNHDSEFDVVCFFQVLEHIYDIKSFIQAALRTLKPGGRMIIAVPYNNPYLYRHDVYHTLNLPPHHAGLWDKAAFQALPEFFPMTLSYLDVQLLKEYKPWYAVQLAHYQKTNPVKAALMRLIPSPIYKLILAGRKEAGRNILVEYRKN